MTLPHRVADAEGLIIGEIKAVFMQDDIDALPASLDLPVTWKPGYTVQNIDPVNEPGDAS